MKCILVLVQKTIVGSGLQLIDMGKDSSTSLLATGVMKRQKSFGKDKSV
jgi:hypothetical protein